MRHRFPGGAEPPRPAVPLPIRRPSPSRCSGGEVGQTLQVRDGAGSATPSRRRRRVGRSRSPSPNADGAQTSEAPCPRACAPWARVALLGLGRTHLRHRGRDRRPERLRLGGDGPQCRRGALRLRRCDAQPRSSHLRGSPPVSGQGEFGPAMGRSGGRGRGGRSEPRGDGVGYGRSATRAKDGPAPDGSAPSPEDARPATQAAAPASAPGPQPAGEARRASLASLQCLSRARRAEERLDDAASDGEGERG